MEGEAEEKELFYLRLRERKYKYQIHSTLKDGLQKVLFVFKYSAPVLLSSSIVPYPASCPCHTLRVQDVIGNRKQHLN
ncbi:hypothetical protein AV530_009277 [Patagioenas fasciata monilis]|uniref:Uncharacterized protein n=1 Tax=Patagioenas fasciata monilis TaxID=372326 RepID=A0A1V4JJI2_PATFA|nr:hypothetical protein AV530_009277 [Patagioenas fasciata monilis]